MDGSQRSMFGSLKGKIRARQPLPVQTTIGDLLDRPFLLTAAEAKEGDYGTYYLLTLKEVEGDQVYMVTTGAARVVEVLDMIEPDDLPALVTFAAAGKSYIIKEEPDQDTMPF